MTTAEEILATADKFYKWLSKQETVPSPIQERSKAKSSSVEPETEDNLPKEAEQPPEQQEGKVVIGFVNLYQLSDSLKKLQAKGIKAYSNKNILLYLNAITQGKWEKIDDAAARLSKEQADQFEKRVQQALEML